MSGRRIEAMARMASHFGDLVSRHQRIIADFDGTLARFAQESMLLVRRKARLLRELRAADGAAVDPLESAAGFAGLSRLDARSTDLARRRVQVEALRMTEVAKLEGMRSRQRVFDHVADRRRGEFTRHVTRKEEARTQELHRDATRGRGES